MKLAKDTDKYSVKVYRYDNCQFSGVKYDIARKADSTLVCSKRVGYGDVPFLSAIFCSEEGKVKMMLVIAHKRAIEAVKNLELLERV